MEHDLIAAVRKHAMLHYNEGGWDYVVEAYEDADILEAIGRARTVAGAIRNVGREVGLRHDYAEDIRNS